MKIKLNVALIALSLLSSPSAFAGKEHLAPGATQEEACYNVDLRAGERERLPLTGSMLLASTVTAEAEAPAGSDTESTKVRTRDPFLCEERCHEEKRQCLDNGGNAAICDARYDSCKASCLR